MREYYDECSLPCEWCEHEYMVRKYVRSVIDRYNERVAEHLGSYMGWDEEDVLKLINGMEDNKWRK